MNNGKGIEPVPRLTDKDEEASSPPVRDYVFKLREGSGDKLYGVYVSGWIDNPEEGMSDSIRYGLAGKKLRTLKIHFVMFVQVKGSHLMILKEGECDDLRFRKLWKDFLKDYKKQFDSELEYRHTNFDEMEEERGERLFEAIISAER